MLFWDWQQGLLSQYDIAMYTGDWSGPLKELPTQLRRINMDSNFSSSDEAKAHHILRMGKDLGTIYDALWHEVASVHSKWSEFVVVFGTKESRIELLNKAAPLFFRVVQDSLWENVLLHLARLTDPPASGKKQNLTVRQLPNLVKHEETRRKVDDLLDIALLASAFARDWRNRHIAHSDLDLSVSETANALEFASRQKVNEALQALVDILDAVSSHYLDSTNYFNEPIGDGLALLYVIHDGIIAEERRREGLRLGEYNTNEYDRRDI